MGKLLTTAAVAERLNISIRRVQAMIKAGRLKNRGPGRELLVDEKDLEKVKDRKPGRPKKL